MSILLTFQDIEETLPPPVDGNTGRFIENHQKQNDDKFNKKNIFNGDIKISRQHDKHINITLF